jgi:hypothetical protein
MTTDVWIPLQPVFLLVGLGLYSGLHTCKAGPLQLESYLRSIFLWFWKWGLGNYPPGLASNHNSPNHSIPRSKDYRHEPLVPGFQSILKFIYIYRYISIYLQKWNFPVIYFLNDIHQWIKTEQYNFDPNGWCWPCECWIHTEPGTSTPTWEELMFWQSCTPICGALGWRSGRTFRIWAQTLEGNWAISIWGKKRVTPGIRNTVPVDKHHP